MIMPAISYPTLLAHRSKKSASAVNLLKTKGNLAAQSQEIAAPLLIKRTRHLPTPLKSSYTTVISDLPYYALIGDWRRRMRDTRRSVTKTRGRVHGTTVTEELDEPAWSVGHRARGCKSRNGLVG